MRLKVTNDGDIESLRQLVTSMHVTGWNLDPWTGGAYSTLAVGGQPQHRATLGEPIDNHLCLAGEHVSVQHPATMHGAYNSGIRAAQQLIDRSGLPAPVKQTALVVGAGLAGLAAAQTFRQSGYDVVVLEATGHIGGRARSETIESGLTIHPGAAWIHGPIGNPIAALADHLGITRVDPWPQRVRHYRSDGSTVEPHDITDIDEDKSRILTELAESGSVADADTAMRGPLTAALDLISDPLRRAAVKVRLDLHFESLMAADLDNLSRRFGDEPYWYPGGDHYISSSLAPLAQHLAEGLRVQRHAPVRTIHQHPSHVEIQMEDGATLTADACVVTVPLGPLQTGALSFEPRLPTSHTEALTYLSMGQKGKVYIAFSEAWWGDADQLWVYPDETTNRDAPTSWALWVDASRPSNAPLLCGFLGGLSARRAQHAAQSESGKDLLLTEALTALSCVPRTPNGQRLVGEIRSAGN
jgi:monoamine oxidase